MLTFHSHRQQARSSQNGARCRNRTDRGNGHDARDYRNSEHLLESVEGFIENYYN